MLLFATETLAPVIDLTQEPRVKGHMICFWSMTDSIKMQLAFQALFFSLSLSLLRKSVTVTNCSYSDLELIWNWPSSFVRIGSWCDRKAWSLLCLAGLPLVGPVFQYWVPKPATLAETPPSWGLPAATFCSSFLLLGCTGAWWEKK